jgi:hypothetical protein
VIGRLRFPDGERTLDRNSIWRAAIEPATFVHREALNLVGPFREDLGVGAWSPWQSGEGTDVLLRCLAEGMTVRYSPRVTVHEERPSLSDAQQRQKVRQYARGTGRVYRLHPYAPWQHLRVLVAPFLLGVVNALRLRPHTAMLRFQQTIGRAEGYAGRTVRLGVRAGLADHWTGTRKDHVPGQCRETAETRL